jgi:hypothetical protein
LTLVPLVPVSIKVDCCHDPLKKKQAHFGEPVFLPFIFAYTF